MQSLKNKLHLNKNSTDSSSTDNKHHLFGKHGSDHTAPMPAQPLNTHYAESSSRSAPMMSSTSSSMNYEIPMAPPAPAVWSPEWHTRWSSLDELRWTRGTGFYENWGYESNYNWSNWSNSMSSQTINRVVLPTQVIEKPMAVHEEIRREQVEEIQPIVNIEKLSTEVHQVTQPIFDKEVMAVNIQERLLDTEVRPEILLPGRGMSQAADHSTVQIRDTAAVVVEKPTIYRETDRLQVIEEIQPVLYKETVVPTVIQETKPMYQKVVEGAKYSQETLAPKDLTSTHAMNPGYVPSTEPTPAPTLERVALPTQIIEKPLAVHEEIRREQVEEIQPVINVEKLSTEVRQLTQPIFDKEVKPVNIQTRTLDTQVLPEVMLPGRGMSQASDYSTISLRDTAAVVVEKPAIYRETDKLQVIEEIQPVLYKETVVPTVIQETKPVYQKIVEGTVFTQSTLAAKDLTSTHAMNPGYVPSREAAPAPVLERVALPTQIVEKPMAVHEEIRREQVEEIQPVVNIEKLQTEIHQVTQPLFDKEIKPVNLQTRTLATEILPEVIIPGQGFSRAAEIGSVRYQDSEAVIIEKPAIFRETDRLQVIEEIQPILYKETIVPTVIQETKPVYQKIVEGTVYTQGTLPPKTLAETQFRSLHTSTWTETSVSSGMSGLNLGRSPVLARTTMEPAFVEKTFATPAKAVDVMQTTTTTTTTTSANLPAYGY